MRHKGEEGRNGVAYTQDGERCLMDIDGCLVEMDAAGIEILIELP